MKEKKTPKFCHGLICLAVLAAVMFVSVVILGAEPQIPLIIGCAAAAGIASVLGYRWDELLEQMLDGIHQSLEAILILFSIGILVSMWIASGTVPTMIYYGIRIVSPGIFLFATFLLCSVISMFVGSWGAAGTVGLAFVGIGQALGIDLPLIAGAIIAGAYVGDKLSPFSDGTNLAAAVAKADIFKMIRQILPLSGIVWAACAVVYLLLGLRYRGADAAQLAQSLEPVLGALDGGFHIGILCLLPLAVMLVCVALKLPSIPTLLAGALVGAIQAVIQQGRSVGELMNFATSGFVSATGLATVDELLSVGGLESMLRTVSIILIAMAFGGIMQGTGMMEALVAPLVRRIRSVAGMFALTIGTCICVNILLPDQYLGISVSGQMYQQEYEHRGLDAKTLGNVLGAGAAVTSPLVPWNTCGMYMSAILGATAFQYLPYAVFNYLMPVAMILFGVLRGNKLTARKENA